MRFLLFFIAFMFLWVPSWLVSEFPPFEKIYVDRSQLITFHDGTYYCDELGNHTKVKNLMSDCDGTYILVVYYQCPICDRCWTNNKPDEGYNCPLFQREVFPGIWRD